jgi:hypothetical protein
MTSNYYIVRNEPADSWQLCTHMGMPCMARSTMAATMATAEKLATVRANKVSWPMPVFHVTDENVPAVWNGSIDRGGNWIDRA